MPPKQKPRAVVPMARVATQRIRQVQTSGIFKLPVELLFEIFSHFDHHRRYIRDSENIFYAAVMRTEHVEQSTVIRKLTMTCWALRDALLPVLWKNTEGCVVEPPSGSDHTRKTYGLYDQCIYLLSNPTSAAYVQVLSVDLSFKDAPKDLMTKFVDTLVRLPNLRTLELLNISDRKPVTRGLNRKCAQFPSIREMTVCITYSNFVKNCPNLESLTFRRNFTQSLCKTIGSHGAELKRVGGLCITFGPGVESVVRGCPKLQEIVLRGTLSRPGSDEIVKHLRQAKNLSIVETHFIEPREVSLENRKAWKTSLIDVLKNSPSKDRKFLRWEVSRLRGQARDGSFLYRVVETEELEVLSEPLM